MPEDIQNFCMVMAYLTWYNSVTASGARDGGYSREHAAVEIYFYIPLFPLVPPPVLESGLHLF